MNVRIAVAGATLLSFSLACSSGGSGGPSLSISPPSLTITAGSTPAGFTATLNGTSATISWSLAGPGSLTGTTGATTTYTPPAADTLPTATTATLTATAGTLTANATININPPAVNLTISPLMLTIVAGGTPKLFTATQTGATNPISWSLTGPGTFSPSTGTTTTYTPPLGVTSQTTATLTATAGALVANASITITVPAAITVTGTVIAVNGSPVSGASISIGAQNAITDSTGTFTISNVTPPYTLVAVSGKVGLVYQELTLPGPTIVFINLNPTPPQQGTVTGNITPATNLGVSGYQTTVAWGSPETSIYTYYSNFSANPYSLSLNWLGPASTTGNLHVLQTQLHSVTGLPVAYTGYQTKQGVVVAASGTTTMQDMTMNSVTTANLSGTVTVPAQYTLDGNVIFLAFADKANLILASDSSTPSAFSYLMPANISATVTLLSLAVDATTNVTSGAFVAGVMPNASGVSVVVPAGSTPGSPPDAATSVTTATNFTWTAYTGGINIIALVGSGTNPTYYIYTAATTTTIPNLTAQGLPLPSGGVAYSWYIYGLAPFVNLDAFATGNNLSPFAEGIFSILFKPPIGLSNYSYSFMNSSRSFTTQ